MLCHNLFLLSHACGSFSWSFLFFNMWVLLLIYCFYIIKRNCNVPSHVHLYHHHTKPKTFYASIYCMIYTVFLDYSGSIVLMTPLCNLSHSLMSPSPCWSFFFSPTLSFISKIYVLGQPIIRLLIWRVGILSVFRFSLISCSV